MNKIPDQMNLLQQSQGYLELDMYQDAWDALEDLTPEDRAHPEVLAMRVRIYLAMGKVEEAQTVAKGMANRIANSGFSWLSLARVEAFNGDKISAKASLKKCFELDPSLRLEALEDPVFEDVWQVGS